MDMAPTEVPGLLLQGSERLKQLWRVMQEPVYWALPTGHRKFCCTGESFWKAISPWGPDTAGLGVSLKVLKASAYNCLLSKQRLNQFLDLAQGFVIGLWVPAGWTMLGL